VPVSHDLGPCTSRAQSLRPNWAPPILSRSHFRSADCSRRSPRARGRFRRPRSRPTPAGNERRSPRRRPRGNSRRCDSAENVGRSIVMGGRGFTPASRPASSFIPRLPDSASYSLARRRTAISVRFENVTDTATTPRSPAAAARSAPSKHLLSVLHAFGHTNLLIKTDDEVPRSTGSALEFCKQLAEAGLTEQDATVEPINIKHKIVIGEESEGLEFKRSSPPISESSTTPSTTRNRSESSVCTSS